MKVNAMTCETHNPYEESHWVSRLRENFTSGSDGEGLETDRKIPRQSFTRQLFFKAIKQNLRIKTFVGTSENAVRIQIWTALISMLLLKYMQLRSKYNWSLSNLTAFFRMILLRHLDLWDWLDSPFEQKVENPPGEYSMRLF